MTTEVIQHTLKKCSKCKLDKPATYAFFSKNNVMKDKLNYICKVCDHARTRSQYYKNIDKCRARNRSRQMRINCRDPILAYAKSTYVMHKLRGYIMNITIPELVEMCKNSTHCKICERKFDWFNRYGNGRNVMLPATLDRIDNGKVISKDTVQIVCFSCNTTKANRSMDEFIAYCMNVVNKFLYNV